MSDLTIRTTPTNNPDSAVDLSKIEVKDGQEIDLYEIHRAFQTITQECPEKLWPNTRQEWTGTELVVFHKGQEQAWTWKVGEDSSPKMIRSIPFEELDPDLRTSEFADDTTGDTKLISYRIDGIHGSTQDKFLSLTLHEGFHYVGQDSWTLPTNAHPGNRSTSVPYHYEARYYRSMIIESLLHYHENNNPNYLGAARYWQDKYESEFPEEAKSIALTDQSEGTAEYIEYVGSALALEGCDVSEQELTQRILSSLEINQDSFFSGASLESYAIGLLSGIILRNTSSGWENKVEQGRTPLSILLENINPITQQDNDAKKDFMESFFSERNQETLAKAKPFLQKRNSANHILAFIPYESLLGSFNMSNNISLTTHDDLQLLLDFEATVQSSNEVGRIHIERQAIQKVIYHPIHGNDIGSGYVIPLPKEYFQEDSGTVSFEEKDIELENVAYQKVPDEKGKTWILF